MGVETALFQGIVIQYIPRILKGSMKEYLGKIEFKEMVAWVAEGKSLWEAMPEKYKKLLLNLAPKLGPLDWFTEEWVMESAREPNPALFSLFVGWPEGQEWLKRQITEIKEHIRSGK